MRRCFMRFRAALQRMIWERAIMRIILAAPYKAFCQAWTWRITANQQSSKERSRPGRGDGGLERDAGRPA